MPDMEVYPVLLAGGSGTRLWPVSRELFPKQLVRFIGGDSLIQNTIKRVSPVMGTDRLRIVCGNDHFYEVGRHMQAMGIDPAGKIIAEPCGRNTGPAILLALFNILNTTPDGIICIFPADHVIKDIENCHETLGAAIDLADQGYIVTFGIEPNYPETGYGYIEGDAESSIGGIGGDTQNVKQALAIKRFVEKPDTATAKQYLDAGNFFWNSGMFAFKASVMKQEFMRLEPELVETMEEIYSDEISREDFERLTNISIDYAIMERTDKGVVLPSNFGWSDIGSWKSLYDFLEMDDDKNVIDGDVIVNDTEGCFIMGHDRLIATNRIKDLVVIETPDSVFVSDLESSREVKTIVDALKKEGRVEHHKHKRVHYPWGTLTILEYRGGVKVEKIVVYPGKLYDVKIYRDSIKRLVVVNGVAEISENITDSKTSKDSNSSKTKIYEKGDAALILDGNASIVKNIGEQDLYIIQVQIGGAGDIDDSQVI